jgi:hypothetical protein
MDDPSQKRFVQEMRVVLEKQLMEFELAKKRKRHDAKIIADEGAKTWSELKDSLKHHVEDINDGFQDGLLSYSDSANGNEFTLRHELRDRNMQVAFDSASALISYQGGEGKGEFIPRIQGDALQYGWNEIARCDGTKRSRMFQFDEDENPEPFSTRRMTEIILRCVVVDPEAGKL